MVSGHVFVCKLCKLCKLCNTRTKRLMFGLVALFFSRLKEEKLTCSEELGDLVFQFNDAKMALAIYLRANATAKVINCFLQNGDYDNIVKYSAKVGYTPDYVFMLQNMVRQNAKAAEGFAKRLVTHESGPLVDANMVAEVFMQMNALQECTYKMSATLCWCILPGPWRVV
jgi:hypothetical protein